MVKVGRILKDYREAGTLNARIALWGFVDDTTFLTKQGAVGVVYRLRGIDGECLDHVERRAVVHRFEQALRQLDERFRVYQYLLKDRAHPVPPTAHAQPVVNDALRQRAEYLASRAESLFELELYLVVLFEGWSHSATLSSRLQGLLWAPTASIREMFSARRTVTVLETELAQAIAQLHQKTDAFAVLLADTIRPVLLQKADAFRFLRRLLNYTPYRAEASLKYDSHLDFYLTDSSLECHRDHLQIHEQRVKVLTMKEPPAKTFAHMLADIHAIPSTFIACLEWQRLTNAQMRRDIQSRRRHFFNRKVSMVNYLNSETRPDEMLTDDAASATVHELGQSLTDMEVNGHFFGSCSLTFVIHDHDPRRLDQGVAECVKAFAAHDGTLHEETYNLVNAWLAVVPGNSAHNVRRLALLNTNCADLSFLFTLDTGERESHHLTGQEYLAVFETEHHTPYFWNLHHHDVGHTLVLGATGSGKSFLLNFIVTHAQKYDPVTIVFDLGDGYQRLAGLLGGRAWRIGLTHQDVRINPFCLDPTPEHLHFLYSFVRVLLESSGQYRLTTHDDRELYEAVESLYALDAPQRRLLTLANTLPRALGQHLHRWVHGGPYAPVFDNVEDTLTFARFQCFDFEGLGRYPLVLEPLLFYILHRASAAIGTDASALKLFVLDEAWRFVRDPRVKAYITEALKTWRKRNAAMVLATQSSEDFVQSDLLRAVLESCPTKFFLANPGIDVAHARELFQLNDTEATAIGQLIPRRQVLLKRPDVAKVLNLHVDPRSYWIYTNTPLDNARVAAVVSAEGLSRGLDRLTATT